MAHIGQKIALCLAGHFRLGGHLLGNNCLLFQMPVGFRYSFGSLLLLGNITYYFDHAGYLTALLVKHRVAVRLNPFNPLGRAPMYYTARRLFTLHSTCHRAVLTHAGLVLKHLVTLLTNQGVRRSVPLLHSPVHMADSQVRLEHANSIANTL